MATVKVNYNDIKYEYLAYPLGNYGVMLLIRANIDADMSIGDYIEFEGDQTTQSKTLMVNTVKAVTPSQLIEGSYPAQYTNTTITTLGVDNLKDDNIDISSVNAGYKLMIKGETDESFDKYVLLNTELSQGADSDARGAYSPVVGWLALYSTTLKRYINYRSFNVGNFGPCLILSTRYLSSSGFVYGESPYVSGVRVFNNITMPKTSTFGIGEILIYPGELVHVAWAQYGQGVLSSESICSKVFEGRDPINIDPDSPESPESPNGKDKINENSPSANDEAQGGNGDYDYTPETTPSPEGMKINLNNIGCAGIWNPSQSELKQLFDFVWTGEFDISKWRRIFADPMDCFISLKAYPIEIKSTTTSNLAVGNVDSGISMHVCDSQQYYVSFSGHVKGPTGTFADYTPYANAMVYLPFIGIESVDIDEIMDRDIRVIYAIDIVSGSLACAIERLEPATKDNKSGYITLYSYSGQIGVDVPISAMDYRNMYSAISRFVSDASSMFSTGSRMKQGYMSHSQLKDYNPTGEHNNIIGDAVNAATSKPTIMRSGAYGGNAGSLLAFVPYIILKYPNVKGVKQQREYTGHKSLIIAKLSDLKGKTNNSTDGLCICSAVNLHIEGATSAELKMIDESLKNGVIL